MESGILIVGGSGGVKPAGPARVTKRATLQPHRRSASPRPFQGQRRTPAGHEAPSRLLRGLTSCRAGPSCVWRQDGDGAHPTPDGARRRRLIPPTRRAVSPPKGESKGQPTGKFVASLVIRYHGAATSEPSTDRR